MRDVVGSILISKYRSWCTLTFLKCVKNGKLCQNATLSAVSCKGEAILVFYHHALTLAPSGNTLSVSPVSSPKFKKDICTDELAGEGRRYNRGFTRLA